MKIAGLAFLSMVVSACFYAPSGVPGVETGSASTEGPYPTTSASTTALTTTSAAGTSTTSMTTTDATSTTEDVLSATTVAASGPTTSLSPETGTSTGTSAEVEPECGNGVVEGMEICDDGNAVVTDECWPNCEKSQCGNCRVPRPNILFVLDYSSSMNEDWGGAGTRFNGVMDGIIQLMTTDYALSQRMNVAFMHYGHDPDPNNVGTKIVVDESGIIDGQKIDFLWTQNGDYLICQHQKLATVLAALVAPANGNKTGIGGWTKGALDRASQLIASQRAQFMDYKFVPGYRIVLITDGLWTSPQGTMQLAPVAQNPALTAQDLSANHNVRTHVFTLGDASGKAFADELATAGGTGAALDAKDPETFKVALHALFEGFDDDGVLPKLCSD